MTGLAPASVCSTLRCVHVSAYTPLLLRRIKDGAMMGLAPQQAMDLGPWRQESRRNPSSPLTHLLQRASEFAALLADSPCCQQVWHVKDCCQQAMDLGPSKQESRHGPGYSSVSPSRPGLTCSRASDFGDWLFPVAVCAVSFQSCLQALDPLDLALLADSRSCRFSNS